MLQSIRDRTQGWIAGVIISLVILSFALWGIHSYLEGYANTDVIAKVGSVNISKRELSAAYERVRRQTQDNTTSSPLSDSSNNNLKQRALDALINIQVLKQASTKEHFMISMHQVDNYLESMPEFQVNGQFSPDRFQQLLATTLYSPVDFLNLIESTLLIDQPRLGILLTSFSLPDEVTNSIALINQERNVMFIQIPMDNYLKQAIPVTDAEIDTYYKAHPDKFKTVEKVTADYLELSLNDLLTTIQPTQDELNNYYKENVNTFTLPMQWQLEKILIPVAENANDSQLTAAQKTAGEMLEKISSGADFAALAKDNPAPDSITSNKSSTTWVTLNQLPVELQKPVSDLVTKGQSTDPIRVSQGYVILKATDVQAPVVQSYDQVKDSVKQSLIKQLAEEKFADLKDKLSNLTYEHPESLEPAAKALGLTIKTIPAFSLNQGNADDLSNNKIIRDTAFNDDVLNSQNNSDVIQVSPDTFVVLHDKSHVAATLQPLPSVSADIAKLLQKQKAEDKAQQIASEMEKKLNAGTSPDQIVTEYSFPWVSEGFIGRYSTKVDSAILFTAFRLPRPEANKSTYGVVKLTNGYALVATTAVKDGAADSSKEQLEVFGEQIQNSDASLEYKLYQNALTKDAKITNYLTDQSKT